MAVQMEHCPYRRRSASHGALDPSHATGAQGICDLARRSASGDAFTLTSPAPLESILKKTTETGDIGFFSIGPTRSGRTSDLPVPSTSEQGESTCIRPGRIREMEDSNITDDRRSLPSYRASASETMSLRDYGSMASGSRSLSVVLHECDRKYYSMTTCSSTCLSSHRPTGTVHSMWLRNLQQTTDSLRKQTLPQQHQRPQLQPTRDASDPTASHAHLVRGNKGRGLPGFGTSESRRRTSSMSSVASSTHQANASD